MSDVWAQLAGGASLILVAPFVGSFLATVIDRLPAGRSIVFDRSNCEVCRERLRSLDLVPIASWIWLRGRCRYCAAPIGFLPITIELLTFSLALMSVLIHGPAGPWISFVFAAQLIVLSGIDARHLVLPDVLTGCLFATGVAIAFVQTGGVPLHHLAGAAIGFLALYAVGAGYQLTFGRAGLGLGDAKLLGGIGAWVGWFSLPHIVLLASASGIAYWAGSLLAGRRFTSTRKIAFGPHLAVAGWIIYMLDPPVP